jgi:hypothetical protein
MGIKLLPNRHLLVLPYLSYQIPITCRIQFGPLNYVSIFNRAGLTPHTSPFLSSQEKARIRCINVIGKAKSRHWVDPCHNDTNEL